MFNLCVYVTNLSVTVLVGISTLHNMKCRTQVQHICTFTVLASHLLNNTSLAHRNELECVFK